MFPGSTALNELAVTFNSALTYFDPANAPRPQLAREIPRIESGDWTIAGDGTMVTLYRLRENAKWHDGAPITAADFVFAYRVFSDPEVPVFRRPPVDSMSTVEARDDQTLVITWR
jgi:ABC-type transport system substrate-binding protein